MNFSFFLALFVQIVAVISAASSCESNKKESLCMSASSATGKCSWCSSGAVGASCYEEADAKSLPSSVFQCEYQKCALKTTACDTITKEADCMKATSGSEKCSWCNSAAVGGTCFIESDAKSLPSSVFQCEYQKAMLKAATTCDGVTSEKTCMSSTFGGDKCSWCTSGAVGATCFPEADAKTLPSSVFQCEYQKAYSLRASN